MECSLTVSLHALTTSASEAHASAFYSGAYGYACPLHHHLPGSGAAKSIECSLTVSLKTKCSTSCSAAPGRHPSPHHERRRSEAIIMTGGDHIMTGSSHAYDWKGVWGMTTW